jgi:hypothetical protein
MKVRIVAAESFSIRGDDKILVGCNKHQPCLAGRNKDGFDRERRRQLHGVVTTQPVALCQVDGEIEDRTCRGDQVVFGVTVARKEIDRVVSLGSTTVLPLDDEPQVQPRPQLRSIRTG